MSCPFPHVPVLINLFRRPVPLLGEASRRAFVRRLSSACLPRALLFSCTSRLAARLSTRRSGRLGDGRRLCLRLMMSC